MRDIAVYKEMATNELNHNARLKKRREQIKANKEQEREKIEK